MKKQLIIFVSAALALGSCSKSYFDINNNPNSATNATPDLVLPNALTVTASTVVMGVTSTNYVSAWMGYLAQSGSYATGIGDMSSYKQTTGFGDPLWQGRYKNLEDYDYIEKAGASLKLPFYQGAAKIMKAYVFQQLVDLFNNVPYSQAFNGTNTIAPKYDSAQTIYNSIVLQIDSAITLMQNPLATSTKTSDVLFGGNTTSWIQFANTLKLRILLRQSQVTSNQSFIQAEYAKIAANGAGFLTTDAAVNPGYANNSGQQSPIWGAFVTITGNPTSGGGADFYKAANYPIQWMINHNDYRYKFIYAPGGKGYTGCILGGGTANPAGTDGATIGKGILKGATQSAVILSAAESYFMQAEANLRGLVGDPSMAQANFNSGVKANFEFLGAFNDTIYSTVNPTVDSLVFTPDQSAAIYTSQNDVQSNYGICSGFNQQLACIIRQKWIAMDMITPFEAYCDYRRVHLPADIPLSISQFLDQSPAAVPIRFLYPTSEYNTNSVNVNAQGSIDYHKSPVFWNQ